MTANREIPKRPEILDSLNYVAHVEAVAKVAVEALRAIYAHTGVSANAMSVHAIDSLLGSIERQCTEALAKIEASGWRHE